MPQTTLQTTYYDDDLLVKRAASGNEAAIREIMGRYNQRLYRVIRSMIGDDAEAEDVLQEAYLKAFTSLASFRGDARLSTWLTRIAINEALQRLRKRVDLPARSSDPTEGCTDVIWFPMSDQPAIDPERAVAQRQYTKLIEEAIDELPDDFRTVLVARVLEDMSIEDTAELLGIKPETVKTRLFRARRLIKAAIAERFEPLFGDAFPFAGRRCERLADAIVAKLKNMG